MAFKLMMSAQKKWRKLDGQGRLPEIIQAVEFRDAIRQRHDAALSSVTNFCAYLPARSDDGFCFLRRPRRQVRC